MRAGKLKTLWIIIYSSVLILSLCIRAIIKTYKDGKLDSNFVDTEMRAWAHRVLDVVKLDYHLENPHCINFHDGEKYIIMLNHSSQYDIPLTLATIPASMRFITKKELFKIPFFGRACQCAGHIKIDRQNHQQALLDMHNAKQTLENGMSIWICPEGTRSPTGKLQAFKKGGFILAIETAAKIIPVGVQGAFDILPAKTFQFNLYQKARVVIGEPIDASLYTDAERDDLIKKVRDEISRLAQIDKES